MGDNSPSQAARDRGSSALGAEKFSAVEDGNSDDVPVLPDDRARGWLEGGSERHQKPERQILCPLAHQEQAITGQPYGHASEAGRRGSEQNFWSCP